MRADRIGAGPWNQGDAPPAGPFGRILTTGKTPALLLHQHHVRTLPFVSTSQLLLIAIATRRPGQPAVETAGIHMVAFQIFGAVMILLSLATMMSNDLRQRH
ncbi:MAG: hypothetical protein J0I29_03725 [Rhizobiales bacterium]|nr:hypothetical protein [Hyphomicrobiales bacterium]